MRTAFWNRQARRGQDRTTNTQATRTVTPTGKGVDIGPCVGDIVEWYDTIALMHHGIVMGIANNTVTVLAVGDVNAVTLDRSSVIVRVRRG